MVHHDGEKVGGERNLGERHPFLKYQKLWHSKDFLLLLRPSVLSPVPASLLLLLLPNLPNCHRSSVLPHSEILRSLIYAMLAFGMYN